MSEAGSQHNLSQIKYLSKEDDLHANACVLAVLEAKGAPP
jgi:hypothetical protein